MENHNFFLYTNKNALGQPKSKLKSLFLVFLILFAQNHMSALSYSGKANNNAGVAVIAPCPNTPTAPSPQIICQWDTVATLKATVDAGATLQWYSTATGGTPLDSFTTLVPGNYYAAAVNADNTCESTRQLVVVATNNALYFNGIRDFVQLSNSPIVDKATEFTIEAWIKPDDSNWNSGYHAIFGAIQTAGNNQRSPSFYLLDGRVHIDSYQDITLARYDILTDDAVVLKNVWSHIALVKVLDAASSTGSTYNVYVNGILVATRTAPLRVNVAAGSIYTFGVVDNYFAGLIDEARFWSTARSASEIATNMNINLTGTEPGLVDYYTFNQGVANGDNTAVATLFDGTTPQNNGTIQNFALTGTTSNFVGGYFAQILSPTSTTVVGGTIQLSHTSPGGVWSSSSDAIATVDESTGLVTGVSGGTAVISYSLCGLSTTYSITVLPNEKPTISPIVNQSTCPGTSLLPLSFTIGDDTTALNSLVLTASSSNTALIPDSQIVLGGTGANRTVTLTTAAGQSGTATITIKATDANGASSTMSFVVSYIDTIAPVADIALLATVTGQCSATVTAPTATDNCSGIITGTTSTVFPITTQGTTVVTWTYTDAKGNSSIQTQSVVLNDTTAPVPNIASLNPVTGQCSATVTAPTATDNCSGTITATTPSPLTYSVQGTYTIIWTYTDAKGNAATQNQTVIVKDTTKPTVITKPKTVELDASGNAIITAADVNNGTTDNCSIATVTVSPTSFNCTNLGPNTVTLTVTDVNGNVSTGTAIVTVTDTTLPTVITQNISVTLDNSGNTSITADQINNGSSDTCGNVTITASKLDFNCNDVGQNTVTLTVKDSSGNTATGIAIVTVISGGCELKISQAITPNGDGINDTWFIDNIEDNPNTTIRVFNRWGAEVFFSNNYKNDWDGHFKNSKNDLPASGAYYYQIDLDSDRTIDNQGWLYITK